MATILGGRFAFDRRLGRLVPRRTLGVGMLLLFLLFVMAVALAAFASDRLASERLEGDVHASDLSLAQAVALMTDAELARALLKVERLAGFSAVVTADSGQMAPLLVINRFHSLLQLKANGLTMLLLEQNVHMAPSVSDYAYVVSEGQVTLEGAANTVADNPAVQAAYLGI